MKKLISHFIIKLCFFYLFIINANASQPTVLLSLDNTSGASIEYVKSINRLVFTASSATDNEDSKLYSMPATGGKLVQLNISIKGKVENFWISPDGKTVYYTYRFSTTKRPTLFSVSVYGGNTKEIGPMGLQEKQSIYELKISPNGKKLFFYVIYEGDIDGVGVSYPVTFYGYDVNSGKLFKVYEKHYSLAAESDALFSHPFFAEYLYSYITEDSKWIVFNRISEFYQLNGTGSLYYKEPHLMSMSLDGTLANPLGYITWPGMPHSPLEHITFTPYNDAVMFTCYDKKFGINPSLCKAPIQGTWVPPTDLFKNIIDKTFYQIDDITPSPNRHHNFFIKKAPLDVLESDQIGIISSYGSFITALTNFQSSQVNNPYSRKKYLIDEEQLSPDGNYLAVSYQEYSEFNDGSLIEAVGSIKAYNVRLYKVNYLPNYLTLIFDSKNLQDDYQDRIKTPNMYFSTDSKLFFINNRNPVNNVLFPIENKKSLLVVSTENGNHANIKNILQDKYYSYKGGKQDMAIFAISSQGIVKFSGLPQNPKLTYLQYDLFPKQNYILNVLLNETANKMWYAYKKKNLDESFTTKIYYQELNYPALKLAP